MTRAPIASPILSNILLDKLDSCVSTVLIPQYTRGEKRKRNKEYDRLAWRVCQLRKQGQKEAAQKIKAQMQRLPSLNTHDPNYRRLRYIRYADDVRHLTRYEILLAEKGGSEERDLRVISPTWTRKPKGKGACEKSRNRVKALKRCPARPA